MKKTLLLSVFLFTIFSHAQTANPAWLTVCEEDTDGFALFDPSAADSQVLDTQNPEDFSISYHSTVSDAQNNVNAVYYPFTNWIAYNQTLYSRLEDFATGNFDTSTLELIVGESFEVEQNIPPLVACDDDNDGIVLFDLTLNNDLILGDLDPTVHSFTYYTTPTDAENGTNAIPDPGNYMNSENPTTIYVVVSNGAVCMAITSFQLDPTGCLEDWDDDLVYGGDEDINANGNLADDDTDEDGIPDYLDADDDGDGIPTADEDYNGNGDPTDDDTNSNGIPDYLDSLLAVSNFSQTNFTIFPNPSSGMVTLQVENFTAIGSITIFDLNGKTVKQIPSFDQRKEVALNLSMLSPGIYFISIGTSQKTVQRLVIE